MVEFMSKYKDVAVGSTVYFWFAANTTAGAAGDGATPLYDARLAGAAAGGAPPARGTPTPLTHTHPNSSVNPGGFVGSVKVRTAGTGALKVDAVALAGVVQSLTDLKDFAD